MTIVVISLIISFALLSFLIKFFPQNLERKKQHLEQMIVSIDENVSEIVETINKLEELNQRLLKQNTSKSTELRIENHILIGRYQNTINEALKLKQEVFDSLNNINKSILKKNGKCI